MGGRRVTSSILGPGRPAWGRCAPAAGEWGPSLLLVPVFSRECDGSSFAERGRSGQARSLAESGKGRKRSLCREAERTGPRNMVASPAGPRPPWGWPQSQPGGSRCSPAALPPLDLGDRGGVKSPQATLEPSLVAHLAFRMAIAWGGGVSHGLGAAEWSPAGERLDPLLPAALAVGRGPRQSEQAATGVRCDGAAGSRPDLLIDQTWGRRGRRLRHEKWAEAPGAAESCGVEAGTRGAAPEGDGVEAGATGWGWARGAWELYF